MRRPYKTENTGSNPVLPTRTYSITRLVRWTLNPDIRVQIPIGALADH